MRAAWYERQGPAREVFVVGEMPNPKPRAGEVRIRIAASGINPGDIKKRQDSFGLGMAYPRVIPMPVAQFFEEFTKLLTALGVSVKIDPMPVEVANPIRCDQDTVHCTYDSDAVARFFHTLRIADTLLKRFATNFYGKISPVHFFWGSLDLAVTRFNGKRAPARPGVDHVQAEAYSHEVISAGFWPGNGGYGRAAFYAYATPTPDGLQNTVLKGKGWFNPQMGEFLLDYADARDSDDPADTVLEFLQETYSAAADLAKWDRPSLDRQGEVAGAMRLKSSHTAQKPPR